MNYRHAYHAGNFADVFKHAVLAIVIEHLKRKAKPFRVIDTHAGRGHYALDSVEASRTLEWKSGIGRLLAPTAPPVPEPAASILEPYIRAVGAMNPAGVLSRYPGSPEIARSLLRSGDKVVLNELHPAEVELLRRRFVRDRQVKVLALDGWIALKSLLPPPERRAVVLIDPPFEQEGELYSMSRGIRDALKRFATGTYLLWFPLKAAAAAETLLKEIASLPVETLVTELWIRDFGNTKLLNGCGLAIVNPPYGIEGVLARTLPFLADRLADGQGSGQSIRWLGRSGSEGA